MSSPDINTHHLQGLYRRIVERVPGIIAIIQKGRFRYANPAACKLLGYPVEELHGLSVLDLTLPEDRDIARTLCTWEPNREWPWSHEIRVLRKDGQPLTLLVAATPLQYDNTPALVLIAQDITAQKRHCERLIQAEKLAAIGRFTSALAHELNNPLTVVVGFAEILLSNLKLDEQDRADLQMVASEANRARQMVHEVLSLCREQGLQKQLVDLNQLIITTLEEHYSDLQTHHVRVATDLDSRLPPVTADDGQLKRVLGSLLQHIGKRSSASPAGCTLTIRTTFKEVDLPSISCPIAEIAVIADEPTPSEEEVHRIFEPRYTTKEADRGLGLALAHHIIRQHEGQLYALSPPHGGLQFVIELPCPQPPANTSTER